MSPEPFDVEARDDSVGRSALEGVIAAVVIVAGVLAVTLFGVIGGLTIALLLCAVILAVGETLDYLAQTGRPE